MWGAGCRRVPQKWQGEEDASRIAWCVLHRSPTCGGVGSGDLEEEEEEEEEEMRRGRWAGLMGQEGGCSRRAVRALQGAGSFETFRVLGAETVLWLLVFGDWCLVFGVWRLAFGFWCLVFGVWRLALGGRIYGLVLVFGVWFLVLLVWCWLFVVWCLVFGVRCLVFGI